MLNIENAFHTQETHTNKTETQANTVPKPLQMEIVPTSDT